jgi:hypothetical protein
LSSKTLEVLQQAFAANALEEIEVLEILEGFVIIKIRLNESLHTFRIPENENVMRLFFDYMDFQASLEGAAVRLELIWNALAFNYSVITRLLQNHADGLVVYADFRYSPLMIDELWVDALRTAGLYVVKDLGRSFSYMRHIVLAKDMILSD